MDFCPLGGKKVAISKGLTVVPRADKPVISPTLYPMPNPLPPTPWLFSPLPLPHGLWGGNSWRFRWTQPTCGPSSRSSMAKWLEHWTCNLEDLIQVSLWPLAGFVLGSTCHVQILGQASKIANWFAFYLLGFLTMLWSSLIICLSPLKSSIRGEDIYLLWHINTNEILGELSHESMISSLVKITCYFHMWKDHHCYGYIINHAFCSQKKYLSEMIWNFIGVYIINSTLHGRLEIQNFSFRVEKYFTSGRSEQVKYLSTLEEKFRISARPCNILYLFTECEH